MDQLLRSLSFSLSLRIVSTVLHPFILFLRPLSFYAYHVFFFLSLSLYIYIFQSAIPSPFLPSRLLSRSSSNLRLLSRSRPLSRCLFLFFFSIVHSPAPLALQTLLADEARFVLNFLNFIFRGFPKFSLPVSIFIFIESLSSIYPPLSTSRRWISDTI